MTDEVQESEVSETISDLFEPEGTETETTSETETEPEEKGEEKPEGETEKPEGEAKPETPSGEEEEPLVPRKALLDERRKRQEIFEENEKLKKQLQGDQTDQNEPDPIDDPDGWKQYQKVKMERELWEDRANKSRTRAIEKHEDFEAKEEHFVTLARKNPELIQEMREHPDPAGFAYETAKKDLDAKHKAIYEEAEKAVLAKLEKEGKLKKSDDKRKSAAEVASLINSPGAGKNSGEVEDLPENPGEYF